MALAPKQAHEVNPGDVLWEDSQGFEVIRTWKPRGGDVYLTLRFPSGAEHRYAYAPDHAFLTTPNRILKGDHR